MISTFTVHSTVSEMSPKQTEKEMFNLLTFCLLSHYTFWCVSVFVIAMSFFHKRWKSWFAEEKYICGEKRDDSSAGLHDQREELEKQNILFTLMLCVLENNGTPVMVIPTGDIGTRLGCHLVKGTKYAATKNYNVYLFFYSFCQPYIYNHTLT